MNTSANKPRMLLHACCAPCSTAVVEQLQDDYALTIYFYNPNIHPQAEYKRRLQEVQRWVREHLPGVEIVTAPYDDRTWFESTLSLQMEPERGERCFACFSLRLNHTASYAANQGYDCFTTTLSISPHKRVEQIHEAGRNAAKEFGVVFFEGNFKKKGGFQRSLQISSNMGFYRQHYCGCVYSMRPDGHQSV